MINICVPVLRRYDLLRELLVSLHRSTMLVDRVYVVDNGRDEARLQAALLDSPAETIVHTPSEPLGLAVAWNWFIQNVPEERIITNDDIRFAPGSVEKIVGTPGDLVWAGFGFSCFLLRDSCVVKIGLFDETISPGYAYYEDEDYLQRLDGRGTREPSAQAANVDAGLQHFHSATLRAASHAEVMEHHRRFLIAQKNYAMKWGVTF
jgi:GT2 family glycosyltransferase